MIETVASTGSTNADLAARIGSGGALAEGLWLVADRQQRGKGRQGRTWFDGTGNFMGSTIVRMAPGDPPPASLALLAGISLQAAVEQHLAPPRRAMLKWPNDVMIGPAKLAGILLERVGDFVIIGIGVNLAGKPDLPERATVALADFAPAPDRDMFARELSRIFAEDLVRWRTFGLGPIITRWLAAAHPEGTPLTVGEPGEPATIGAFAGLDETGALILALPDGTRRTIHAGEVRLADERQ